MANHVKDVGKYGNIKSYSDSMGNNGYPNKVANTQTQKTRGMGAASKGTGHSKKMG